MYFRSQLAIDRRIPTDRDAARRGFADQAGLAAPSAECRGVFGGGGRVSSAAAQFGVFFHQTMRVMPRQRGHYICFVSISE